jgi:hypothetical protein
MVVHLSRFIDTSPTVSARFLIRFNSRRTLGCDGKPLAKYMRCVGCERQVEQIKRAASQRPFNAVPRDYATTNSQVSARPISCTKLFDPDQTVTVGLSSDSHENGSLQPDGKANLMVPNISDQPAHLLNAQWTIRDG